MLTVRGGAVSYYTIEIWNNGGYALDHTEKKEMEEQCFSKNENETNDSSEPEKSSNDEQFQKNPEEKEQQEQCSDKNENETNDSSEPKKGSTNWLRSMLSVIVSDRGLRFIEVLCIAVTSLIFSIMSYRTQDLEYKLNLANSKLHVEVYCDTTDYNNDGSPDTDILEVKYVDGVYEDFDLDTYSVLTFVYCKTDTDIPQEIDILIRNYFPDGYFRNGVDTLCARFREDNWSKYRELYNYLVDEQEEYYIAYVELSHYVIISYKDIIGENEVLGYKCESYGRFDTVDPEQLQQYINGLSMNREITLEDLVPEAFMPKVKEFVVDQGNSEEQ